MVECPFGAPLADPTFRTKAIVFVRFTWALHTSIQKIYIRNMTFLREKEKRNRRNRVQHSTTFLQAQRVKRTPRPVYFIQLFWSAAHTAPTENKTPYKRRRDWRNCTNTRTQLHLYTCMHGYTHNSIARRKKFSFVHSFVF